MIELTIRYIQNNKLRTILTSIAIAVAIFSLISLFSLAEGMREEIKNQLERFGPRTLMISPTAGTFALFRPTSGKLFEKDYERVKKHPDIKTISKILTNFASLEFKERRISGTVFSVEPQAFLDTVSITLEKGRFIKDNDKKVAVVGGEVEELFDEKIELNSKISINGEKFRVVGILKKTGNSFFPIDKMIIINYDEGKDLFKDELTNNEISAIRITLREGANITRSAEEIKETLRNFRGLRKGEEDFRIITPESINKQFLTVLDILSAFLLGTATVSLIIGSLGIANTMVVNVLQRTREIGILKAIGTTEKQIEQMFILESALIGGVGGIMGVAMSALISLAPIPYKFDIIIATLTIMLSIIIGAISGWIPSKKAAKVDPIESLRYE